MSTDEYAYSTDNPTIIAAFRKACADNSTWLERLRTDVKALGAGDRYYGYNGGFGDKSSITGLEQKDDHIPDGWRIVRGRLEPRRGKPGEAARQWLTDHQPVDVRYVMTQHGMPRAAWIPSSNGNFNWRIVGPSFFEHDGTLWVCYAAEPGTGEAGFDTQKCTWTPRKLSEFYAAKEADAEAAKLGELMAKAASA